MAMVVGTVTPAPILAGILKFPPANIAYFVGIALLASAVGTYLHSRRYAIVGCGLLSVTGTRFATLGPLILAGQNGGLALAPDLGAPNQAAWVKTLPGWIEALLESGIAAGGLTALVLNLILPKRG